jgi:ShK domain-like
MGFVSILPLHFLLLVLLVSFACLLWLLPAGHHHHGVLLVHAAVYFQRDDGTTCINGICYGIDPSIYKEIPMFNDCVDLRANCPQRVQECRHLNGNANGDDDEQQYYSLVSSTKSTTTRSLSSSQSSSSSSSLSSWRYVQAHCPKTCGVCQERIRSVPLHEAWEPPPIGYPDNLVVWDGAASAITLNGENGNNIEMDSGVVQILDADGTHDHVNTILERLTQMQHYLQHEVLVQDRYKLVRKDCVNHHEYCAYWAAVTNACIDNAAYMIPTCPAVCRACHELHDDAKCPKHNSLSSSSSSLETNNDAWNKRGDLHRMFQSLVSDPDYAQYSPKILSRPSQSSSRRSSGHMGEQDGNNGGPWIVQLDDFLNDAEVDRFLHYHGVGARANNKKRAGRHTTSTLNTASTSSSLRITTTSTNTQQSGHIQLTMNSAANRNCTRACAQDEIVWQVLNRLERLTGIPVNNTEPLQLHRSSFNSDGEEEREEEEEDSRHDFLEHQVERMEGPRILSIVLFLNDDHDEQQHPVDDSGETTTTTNESDNSSSSNSNSINTVDNSSDTGSGAASATTTIFRDGGEGGGGHVVFPRLDNLRIGPKRGRALIWPNVLNDNPNQPDFRTVHCTRRPTVVAAGTDADDNDKEHKEDIADRMLFRVNVWLHLRDFATPKELGCA